MRAVQERRRSNAAGPHDRQRPREAAEPCVCDTGFACLARRHDDAGVATTDIPTVPTREVP